jgi:hypothetical protein
MPKFTVRVWYVLPRVKEIEVEAESQSEAYRIGEALVESEDANSWAEWDDAEVQIDVEPEMDPKYAVE